MIDSDNAEPIETAYFAGGCFWGIEYWFRQKKGVLSVISGYMGGETDYPEYEEVCQGHTGHAETVKVIFKPQEISFESLARLFFEIHDFTQVDRQGPDIGTQYRSAVFYTTPEQKNVVTRLIALLEQTHSQVATQLIPAGTFWPAEEYHQNYYHKTGKEPYCHFRRKVFAD